MATERIHTGSYTQTPTNMLTDYDKQEIAGLYEDGWYPEDIAEELGLDETEVVEFCEYILEDLD